MTRPACSVSRMIGSRFDTLGLASRCPGSMGARPLRRHQAVNARADAALRAMVARDWPAPCIVASQARKSANVID